MTQILLLNAGEFARVQGTPGQAAGTVVNTRASHKKKKELRNPGVRAKAVNLVRG